MNMLSSPGTHPVDLLQGVEGNIDVIHNLEVVHAHADKIGAIVEGVLKTIFGLDGAGGQHFKGNPGLFQRIHKIDRFLRFETKHIVVPLGVVLRRPVVMMVNGFHPEVGF